MNVLVSHLHTEFGKVVTLRDQHWKKDDDRYFRLKHPLPKRLFLKPLAERYRATKSWSFFSLYHPGTPEYCVQHLKVVIADGTAFLRRAVIALVGARSPKILVGDFPVEVNRVAVRLHIHRERSAAAAYFAKVRDAFTCRVCDFQFGPTYGRLGEGFAESHHVLPLSSAKLGARTRPDDLITVCANCHRMFHRLAGRRKDAERLRYVLSQQKKSKKHTH
jgi:5-methylcytosine-specific restriction endonuclease McrA